MLYSFVKAAHLIFVISWMAGLLIYPRYKIHQLGGAPGDPLFETMKEASNKLRKIILTPSLLLVWALGIALIALNPELASGGWLHLKLLLVLVMTGFHGWFVSMGKKVDAGASAAQVSKLRLLNEVPFLLMIAIVILVIVKPF